MKRELILTISIIIFICLIANVSAGIYFSQLEPVYNLGDILNLSVDVSPADAGPIKISLLCDNNSLEVYKGAPNGNIVLPLNSLWTNGMTGECYFKGEYNGEAKESVRFKISKKLNVYLSTDSFFAKPGETITISGNAKKLNGEGINGDVEVKIPSLISANNSNENSLYGKVVNGEFSIGYSIGKDSYSGDYRIDVIAYEESSGERTSEGMAMASLRIFQVLKDIDIAIDNQNVDPGKSINLKPLLSDQSGLGMSGDVFIVIKNENSRFFEKMVGAGETIEYKIPTNMTAGYYEIEASADSLTKTKKFYVNEKAIASFELRNNTLIVKSIGNIPYNKSIIISLNGKDFVRRIDNLESGQSKEFKLTGVNSEYDVKVSDGESEINQGKLFLTGAAVGVGDSNGWISGLVNTPIAWIIFIIILGGVILFLFRDLLKKKSIAYPAPEKSKAKLITNTSQIIKLDAKGREIKEDVIKKPVPIMQKDIGDKKLSPIIKPSFDNRRWGERERISEKAKEDIIKRTPMAPVEVIKGVKKETLPSEAEQVLVLDGQRSRASVIALKIKNPIAKLAKENLEKSIEHVYDKKGAVYESGDFIFVIFSPLITKTFKNEIEAAKAAERIVEELKEHNRKFSDRIDFGIGINSGDIINKIEDKKLKFTSLGSLTIAAKKLADFSKGEILMTKEAYEKAMTEIKADKKEINGMEAYELRKVADYEKNKKFIENFLRREGENKNKSMIPSHSVSPKPASTPYWIKDEEKKDNNSQMNIP